MTDSNVERGAAEDASGVPVTPTDIDASRTPPSRTAGSPDSPEPATSSSSSSSSLSSSSTEDESSSTEDDER